MNIRKLKTAALAASLLSAMALASVNAQAGTATGSLGVTASVAANCSVTTSPVAFGAYSAIGTGTINGTGSLAVTCAKGTTVSNIQLGTGGAATAGYTRSMTNAGGDKLGYDLYVPATTTGGAACAYTTKWDSSAGVFNPGVAGGNTAITYNVCGQTTQGQNVTIGNYTDTVPVTVNF